MMSVYLHIPFCVGKCHYCGFYSTRYDEQRADLFLDALERELELRKNVLQGRRVRSLYVGGGTPSVLSLRQIDRLITVLKRFVPMIGALETTFETNPGTASNQLYSVLRQCGVNRISIGIQSFSDEVLSSLGRPHSATQAVAALENAHRAGFSSVSLDLIYGIPGQTGESWTATLDTAIRLRPQHISIYCLSLDENSRFYRDAEAGNLPLPPEEDVIYMYERAIERLDAAGYGQYEISNFATPGHECIHNLHYWNSGEFVGFGPSAWSSVNGLRFANIADAGEYVHLTENGKSPVVFEERIEPERRATETLMLGLRKRTGIDLQAFSRAFGESCATVLLDNVAKLDGASLFEIHGGFLRLTRKGMLLSNEALSHVIT